MPIVLVMMMMHTVSSFTLTSPMKSNNNNNDYVNSLVNKPSSLLYHSRGIYIGPLHGGTIPLCMSYSPGRNENENNNDQPVGSTSPVYNPEEETLLRVHLSLVDNVTLENAMEQVSKYCQQFPFAAILPVQPLNYLPTNEGGVDVVFLRKKTQDKGSVDGGMRFFVRQEREGIEVVVKRNSEGQSVPKMFSEKIVVQAFVKGISGEETEKTGLPPVDFVSVESVFHKWL